VRDKSPTIHQVAAAAGVSTATVSRVLAAADGVSEELTARVLTAVAALDYRPNRAARNLRKRVVQIVGLVISDIQNPFFTSVVRGIERVLEEEGYTLLLSNSDEDPQREQRHLATLAGEGVAGIVLAPAKGDSEALRRFIRSGPPLVIIDRSVAGISVDTVKVNNEAGAFHAVAHLIAQGHHRIALISGPDQITTAYERRVGYQRALAEAGLELIPAYVQISDFRQAGGHAAMRRLLDFPQPPTALLTANNLMTLGALQAIHDRKLRIPQDIAIVGFDDMPWAASLQPPLTAVAQPTYDLGVAAAQMLLARIHDPDRAVQQTILDTQLIVRASSTG
jgi:DNA-binding LacI/PurR family transcriptional regulator